MKLQKSKNKYDCLPSAFAIACNVPILNFKTLISSMGEDILYPHLPLPNSLRGWHYQECMIAAYKLGFICMPIEVRAALGPDENNYITIETDILFHNHDRYVLINDRHAVASDGQQIYDPSGFIKSEINIYDYLIIIAMFNKSNQKMLFP